MARPSRQQCKKKLDGECLVCGEADYRLLDAHRIVEGGTYHPSNIFTCCSTCHRRVHADDIRLDRKYLSSKGWLMHWFLRGEGETWQEMWTPVKS